MKTLLLDCSPKRSCSTSGYLLSHLSVQIRGEKHREKLLIKNYRSICERLADMDTLVLAMPIYVDGVPGSVLRFFEYLQAYREEHDLPSLRVYAIVNCGFYEGRQTATAHAIIQNFCDRCGFQYMGGIGQGAGEMIGVIRFVNPFIAVAVSLIQFIVNAIILGPSFTFLEACRRVGPINITVNILLYFIFNIFMYIAMCRLGSAVRKQKKTDVIYSTVFCPRPLFVVFADLFWIIKAMLRGVPVWKLCARPYTPRSSDATDRTA